MVKRKSRSDDPELRGEFPCPEKYCNYRGASDRAVAIHMTTKHRCESDHSSDESSSSPSETAPSSSETSSVGSQSTDNSDHSASDAGSGAHAPVAPAQLGSPNSNAASAQISPIGYPGDSGSQSSGVQSGLGMSVSLGSDISGSSVSHQSDGEDSVPGQVQSASLAAGAPSPHELDLLEILVDLPQRTQDQILRIITSAAYDPQKIRWTSSRIVKRYLKSMNHQVGPLPLPWPSSLQGRMAPLISAIYMTIIRTVAASRTGKKK